MSFLLKIFLYSVAFFIKSVDSLCGRWNNFKNVFLLFIYMISPPDSSRECMCILELILGNLYLF